MRDPVTKAEPLASIAGRGYSPDRHRTQVLWLALGLVGLLTVALVVLVAYGLEVTTPDYGEPLLLIGLLALVTCTVAYFADNERKHRAENQRLIMRLQQTAEALDIRVARLNRLSETSVHLAGALDVDRISELVVKALVEQVHADAASLVLLDTTKGEYVHTRSMGPLSEETDAGHDPGLIAAKAEAEGPASGELAGTPAVAERLKAWDKIRASISAPMKVSDVIGGALAAIREDSFDAEDLNLLTTLASICGKAIESAELHQQLRQSYYRTLHVLSRSLAARDPYSAAHGEAVTWLASRLGSSMGLPAEEIAALDDYGPLHDLGKIGVGDSLLTKEGPLTEQELEIVRHHTVIGESIIQPLNPGKAALAMIRNHHERWDGTGYPDGLTGEKIPLLARIVAVADAYHAIVSHRPYRGGASPMEAIQEIRAMSRMQFDPQVVEALTALWHNDALADYALRLRTPNGSADPPGSPYASTSPLNGQLPASATRPVLT